MIAALTPEHERAELTAHLLALVRKQLVQPDALPTRGREDRYRFEHALIQEAAYGAVPKEVEADLHERVADWATALERGMELDELVGYHLERAYRHREGIGQLDAQRKSLAGGPAGSSAWAGRRAFARDDMPAAVKLLDRALAPGHEGRAGLSRPPTRAQRSAVLRGRRSRAPRSSSRDVSMPPAASDDRRLEWTALLERAARRGYTHADEGELLDVAVRAITVFEELGDDLGLARASGQSGVLSRDRLSVARPRKRPGPRAGARAPAGHAGGGSHDRSAVHRVRLGPAPGELAIARCESFLARPATPLLEATWSPPSRCSSRYDRGLRRGAASLCGAKPSSRSWDSARTIGAAFLGGLVELLGGRSPRGRRHVRKGYDAMVEAGLRQDIPFQGALLAEALRRQDRQAEAARIARESSEAPSDDALGAILCRTAPRVLPSLYDGHVTAAAGA